MKRFRNKAFLVSLFSTVLLLVQALGFDIFPNNVTEIFNLILTILVLMGVIIDPTTEGLEDKK